MYSSFSQELGPLLSEIESNDGAIFASIDLDALLPSLGKNLINPNSLKRDSISAFNQLRNSSRKSKETRSIQDEKERLKLKLSELEREYENNTKLIHQLETKRDNLKIKWDDLRSRNKIGSRIGSRRSTIQSTNRSQNLSASAAYWKKEYEQMLQKYQSFCQVLEMQNLSLQ